MVKPRAQAETLGGSARTYAQLGPDQLKQFQIPLDPAKTYPMAQNWIESGQRWSRFYQLRLRKDFETLAGLTLCRTPQDAGMLWMNAVMDAARDYGTVFSSFAVDKDEKIGPDKENKG